MPQSPLIKNTALAVIWAFLSNFMALPPVSAQEIFLPPAGTMVHLSSEFNPPILKGIKVYPDNPFHFDFILDKGDSRLSDEQLKDESSRLIRYFLASVTVPEKDLWVNLSPYEKDRIVPGSFGLTQMGRDLLAEDYLLKQITASLIYPENVTGRKFWKEVYAQAAAKYGTTQIPVNTFNKVWIVPEKAVVYENDQTATAYVVQAKLKVMLEQDYLALSKNGVLHQDSSLASRVLREIVIPQLDKEVNEGRNFYQLRQVYNSLILAAWYKKKITDSILEQSYANQNKIAGININDPNEKQKIYQQYLRAFKIGVFNYIKEEPDIYSPPLAGGVMIPRKYFSGGIGFTDLNIKGLLQPASFVQAQTAVKALRNRAMLINAVMDESSVGKPRYQTEGPIAHLTDTVLLVHPLNDRRHYQYYQQMLDGVTHRIVLTNYKFPMPEVLGNMKLQQEDSYMGAFILSHHFGSSAAFIGGNAGACLGTALLTSAKEAFFSRDKFQAYVFTQGIWTDFSTARTLEEELEESPSATDFLIQEFKGIIRHNQRQQKWPWKLSIILDIDGQKQVLYQDKKSQKELVISIVRPRDYAMLSVQPIHASRYRSFKAAFEAAKKKNPQLTQSILFKVWADPKTVVEPAYAGFDSKFAEFSTKTNVALADTLKDMFAKLQMLEREKYFSFGFDPTNISKPDDVLKAFANEIASHMPFYLNAVEGLYPQSGDAEGMLSRADVQNYLALLKTVIDRWRDDPIKITVEKKVPVKKRKTHFKKSDVKKMKVERVPSERRKGAKAVLLDMLFNHPEKLGGKIDGLLKPEYPDLQIIRTEAQKLGALNKEIVVADAHTAYNATIGTTFIFSNGREINVHKDNGSILIAAKNWDNDTKVVDILQALFRVNKAMVSLDNEKGGIDLTASRLPLEIRNNVQQGIKFHLDAAMAYRLQNAAGFRPVIISIQPLVSPQDFLGLKQS